ncbi:hypothetical protein SO802_001992 [Lithocarpus litseifolius]|uniref:Secreted protein n=1 Tax=Lithocarpus litseifolius TaxID=425828 RepID=A0AAW2DZF9_9ROSI
MVVSCVSLVVIAVRDSMVVLVGNISLEPVETFRCTRTRRALHFGHEKHGKGSSHKCGSMGRALEDIGMSMLMDLISRNTKLNLVQTHVQT